MRILVAEDEQRAREGLCDLISSMGEQYQIVGSAGPETGRGVHGYQDAIYVRAGADPGGERAKT